MSASLVRAAIVSEFRRTSHAAGAGPERRSSVRIQVDACRFAFDPVGTGVWKGMMGMIEPELPFWGEWTVPSREG